MDHGLEIVHRSDGGELGFGVAEKSFVDVSLYRGAAVRGAERDPQAAGGDKFRLQSGCCKNISCHLTGVKSHRPHGFSVLAGKSVVNGIINRAKDS